MLTNIYGRYEQKLIKETPIAEFVCLYAQIIRANPVMALPSCDIDWLIQKRTKLLNFTSLFIYKLPIVPSSSGSTIQYINQTNL